MTSRVLAHPPLHHVLQQQSTRIAPPLAVRAMCYLTAHSIAATSASPQNTNTKTSRRWASSSWVPPERRGRDRLFYDKNRQTQQGNGTNGHRRPWQVNGKSVPFHVNDLKRGGGSTGGVAPLGASSSSAASKYVVPIKSYESDLVVVLDLDECLVHTKFPHVRSPGAKYAHQVRRANGANGHANGGAAKVDTFSIALPEGDLVRVHQRPFLHEFLQHVSERYETHLFTAGVPIYADAVLTKLDPRGSVFTKRWYRDSCTFQDGAYVKDLTKLATASRTDRLARPSTDEMLSRMVLVDNNPFSFFPQPSNGILVAHFFDDPHDATLLGLTEVLDELNDVGDVRPVLEERFGLKKVVDDIQRHRQEEKMNAKKPMILQNQPHKSSSSSPPNPVLNMAAAMIPSRPPPEEEEEEQLHYQRQAQQ